MTNTSLLRQMIESRGFRYDYICKVLGVTYSTLRRKINNMAEFTASEISAFSALLGLTAEDRDRIFFAEKCE